MELNFQNIHICEPSESIITQLESTISGKNGRKEDLIEIISYGMSLLKKDDLDLKLKILISLYQNNKRLTQLIEEFGKKSDILRAIYELVSFGFLSEKNLEDKPSGYYKNYEYFFSHDRYIYKISKILKQNRRILESEKTLLENEILFQCKKCNKTYNYIAAMTNNFCCCEKNMIELNKNNLLIEINKKIDQIDSKLEIVENL
ncbi:MAG: hypothetical protein GF329_11990 [Candidatus Lokiarchaeota archaeon]|nr:hypothetical protein [Candidatus Lokiarchaeota archaeon]